MMLARLLPFAKLNKLSLATIAAGLLSLTACIPYARWSELAGPKAATASNPAPVENTRAWEAAVKSGNAADTAADVARVVALLPTPASPIAAGVEGFTSSYAAALHEQLRDIKARQETAERARIESAANLQALLIATGDKQRELEGRQRELDQKIAAAPTEGDVYKAIVGAGLVGAGGVLVRRKGSA